MHAKLDHVSVAFGIDFSAIYQLNSDFIHILDKQNA